ncbi:helix-turn-helix domain-containing protein [Methylobacterium nodulans]|uniref:Helix-turn-helix domain protein n=1 Tax=Methylobacterium nodulans (strain LMG 21967 / CNCM I-2342 / ORS 2060) TaxID=460265 RepID=B8I9N9_METNO|nr:helix-turn-helix domain-containing protein [Methylobacterium nodulans]ACL55292.1 helix-turn-helix domain protein [Methylobacterium nodulans ORS 2060]
MLGPDQRRDLGAFVRSHRERLRPDLPTGRRRTPGLRREELAARAGISATWCAWIEQGRDVQVSAQALDRLAAALALTRAERAYLFELAGRRDPQAARPEPVADAPASLRDAVAALDHPAYGLDRLWNACCWNAAAARLFRGWLDGEGERNLLRFVFLDPAARRLIPAWEERARRVIAEFRADYGHSRADPRARALVEELRRASPRFAAIWDEQDVRDRTGGLRRFLHPEDGPVAYIQHSFAATDRPDYKLILLVPVGRDDTGARSGENRLALDEP